MRLGSLAVVALLAVACGGDDSAETVPPSPASCDVPNRLVGEVCIAPGVADDGCVAGTLGQADGSCRPAGMLPADCAEGFVHLPFDVPESDALYGAGTCEPVLPMNVCPPATMAVPGDEACRPVMDCGSGTWGNIPVDGATIYVDQSFSGTSNGSATAPFRTIEAAMAISTANTLIAIAAGSYNEDLNISGWPNRVHGVCPELVEIVAAGVLPSAVYVGSGASGSEVKGVAVTGNGAGIFVERASDVVFDSVWVHDNRTRGVIVQAPDVGVSVTLRDSLVENNTEYGVFVGASALTVERSVVRDSQPLSTGYLGRGLEVQPHPMTGAPGSVTIAGSLFERNREVSLHVTGASADVDATVFRDTLPAPNEVEGRGINIQEQLVGGARSTGSVRRSLIERNVGFGVLVSGSEASFDAVTVRDTAATAQGNLGRGIEIGGHMDGTVAVATIARSVLTRNRELAVMQSGSQGTMESVVIRDTAPNEQGEAGRAMNVQASSATFQPSSVTVIGSSFERNGEFGICVASATLELSTSRIIASAAAADGLYGDGLSAFTMRSDQPSIVVIDAAHVSGSVRAGVSSFGGSVSLARSAISCNAFELAGEELEGVAFSFEDRGFNRCGCEQADACRALSVGLEPPPRIDDGG